MTTVTMTAVRTAAAPGSQGLCSGGDSLVGGKRGPVPLPHKPTHPSAVLPPQHPLRLPPTHQHEARSACSNMSPEAALGAGAEAGVGAQGQALTGPTGPYRHAPTCASHTCASHTCCTHMQGNTPHLRAVVSRGELRGGWTFCVPEPRAGACRDSSQLLRRAGEDTAFPKSFHLPARPRRPPDAGRMRPSPL